MAMRIPSRDDIVGLTAEQQQDDIRAAVADLAQAWETWRQHPRFPARDDVPPPPWKRAPTRARKPKPPSKGELIAHLATQTDTTLDQQIAAIWPLLGIVWGDWPDAADQVRVQVERLRWLWSRHGLWRGEQTPARPSLLGAIADGLNAAPRNDRGTH